MKKLITFLMLLSVFGIGNVWADNADFSFATKWKSNSQIVNDITVTFSGTTSDQTGYRRIKKESTTSVSAAEGKSITSIAITFTDQTAGTPKTIPTTSEITVSPSGDSYSVTNEVLTWTGNSSSVVFTVGSSGNTEFDITNITVTYSDATPTEYDYVINIADLRFEHLTYGPGRTGIYGFDITTSGWQSQTSGDDFSLLLSPNTALSNNSFTVAVNSTNSSAKITQLVIVGDEGTFSDVTSVGANTYTTTKQDQLIWQNSDGAGTATISFITSSKRPAISQIYVKTDKAMSYSKQTPSLSFSPNTSGTADPNITDYQIDSRLMMGDQYFRADSYTVSNAEGSNATFNQYHLSTGKAGVNTGTAAGTATITANFDGTSNPFYNTSSVSYGLTINTPVVTANKTITIDDMRYSKVANSNGLNADDGLDRTLGGFAFTFSGKDGIKFNNGDGITIRKNNDSNIGTFTITPQKSGTGDIKITRVDIVTYPSSDKTNGTVTVSGLGANQEINNVSSFSFPNLNSGNGVNAFTMTAVSGTIYIKSFTIYYSLTGSAALNDAKVTPTLTWDRPSDSVTSGSEYTSPVLTTNPSNYDVTITNNNTDVATVKSTNRNTPPLITLSGEDGTSTITASAAASDFFNAAENAVYTVNVTPTTVSEKWNFTTLNVTNTINDTEWEKSGDYYKNKFTATQNTAYNTANTNSQIYELGLSRNNSGGLEAGQIRLFSSYMTFTNSAMLIKVPVTTGQKVLVTFDGGNGDTEAGFKITGATVDGDAGATKILSDATQTTATLTASANGYVTLETTKSKVKLYSIQVKTETRKTLDLRDSGSNTYEKNVGTGSTASTDNHFNHRVTFTPSDGAAEPITYTADASNFTITSSDPSVLDVSNVYIPEGSFGNSSSFYFNNIIPKASGTATLTVTFAGNENYLPSSYTSTAYTVYGPTSSYLVAAENQEIQQGQFSNITPKITDEKGNLLGIRLMDDGSGRYTTYVLGEEEDEPDYTDFFTFAYATGSGTGTNYTKITVNSETGRINTGDNDGEAAVGATRKITVTATPKEAYASAFSSTTAVTTELTVTIIEKTANIQVDFFWDADCTTPITLATSTVSGTDNTYADKVNVFDSGIFNNGFPNGRVIYAKPKNEGDAIWFSYAQKGDAAVIPANPSIDKKKRIFQYRRGIPIYIDDNLGSEDYVTVNVVATTYDANTKKYNLRGTVARLKFPKIVSHDRPDQPTYDPVSPDANASLNKDGRKIMNTAENVVAYGEGASKTKPTGNGTLVYGKFSTGTVYTTEQLINEKAVQQGKGSVPVVSTEVAKRRFTSVQIKHYTSTTEGNVDYNGADYISEQTYTEYWYLYDTDLRLYRNPEKTTAYPNQNINVKTSTALPYYKVMWYNKKNYDDPTNYDLGEAQEVSDYAGKIKYEITDNGGLTVGDEGDVKIDASTGVVTSLTNKEGRIKVTATYLGGEQHGGKSGEPQYTSTTDESTADFYVYIYDADKEVPTINPQSRNFTGMMTYTITAPENWDVVYTTDGNDPVVPASNVTPTTNYIAHTGSVSKKIGESTATITVDFTMADDATHTVKAIAYNPNNKEQYSVIVSESYTKKAPLPAPTFDPSGVAEPYKYNTNELTVQIACAYPSAVIYYTTDGKDPVIGASNTYKYSGLSKVVISGNVTITAVAYDPVAQIYSAIIPSVYQYSSEMNKPFFQISTDNGATWYGYSTEDASTFELNGKKWYNGQSRDITPSTQIRIVDPNPVTGTIFYTTNGDVPADNATTLIYSEGYPFTVGKTTIGQAITILEDAQSPVSTANFTISTATYGNVWEAVTETTTAGKTWKDVDKRGIFADDGFTISTNAGLVVSTKETGTENAKGYKVNKNSIQGETNSNGGTTSKMYAQPYITATLGGKMPYDDQKNEQKAGKEWIEMTIADAAIGAPIDGVGTYSLKNDDNVRDENRRNFRHAYLYRTDGRTAVDAEHPAPTVHQKTFSVPASGSYVRFEPERDGDLTIWVLQQGALLYEDDTYFIDNVLRLRPVYLVDEQGKSQKVKVVNNVPQMWSSARLSENWTKIQATAAKTDGWMDSHWTGTGTTMSEDAAYTQYLHLSDGKLFKTLPSGGTSVTKITDAPAPSDPNYVNYYKKVINKGPNREETAAIYNLYKADLDKNYVNVGDPIKPFAVHTGQAISINDGQYIDNSDDQTGYVLASGGYAKYTFEVKAGKTYYFIGESTKIGLRGFQFVPTENVSARTTVEINADATTSQDYITGNTGKTVNVTLNRTFKENTWTTLVLPFSVSETALQQALGTSEKNVDVIHFDNITGDNNNVISMKRHWYKMIVAGTPIMIYPRTPLTSVTFNGVQIEDTEIDNITGSCDDYTMMATYSYLADGLQTNDYYMNTSGNFRRFTGTTTAAVKATRAWLRPKNASNAKALTTLIEDVDDGNNQTTGISVIEDEVNGNKNYIDGYVYNLQGQLVSKGSMKNLPQGIYVVNGKKVVIK